MSLTFGFNLCIDFCRYGAVIMNGEVSTRLVLNVEEARRLLGLSRGLMYQAIKSGEIPSLRIGKRILIPRIALDCLLNVAGNDSCHHKS
jgi:excisionase family DNA binding protein